MKNEMLDLNYIKKRDMELLIAFKKICYENNLKFYLAYGTLLGAVRHKGFIPWDDDIDVWMPRKDYNKFIKLSRNLKSKNFEILHYTINNKFLYPWAKICDKGSLITPSRFNSNLLYGISIDIFPLDALFGESEEENIEYVNKFNKKYKKEYVNKYSPYNGYSVKKGLIKFIIKRMHYVISSIIYKNSIDTINKFEEELYNNDSNYVSYIYDLVAKPFAINKKYFEKTIEIEFENELFPVPKEYDFILTKLYGDYMELPPKEKQVTHHNYVCIKNKKGSQL